VTGYRATGVPALEGQVVHNFALRLAGVARSGKGEGPVGNVTVDKGARRRARGFVGCQMVHTGRLGVSPALWGPGPTSKFGFIIGDKTRRNRGSPSTHWRQYC
jgi:hypothetical protein